jgi:subtilisin family serine protease
VRVGLAVVLVLGFAAPAQAAFPADPPNDPLFDASPLPNATNEQWDLASPALGFDRGISIEGAWRLSTGEGVVIADIDVGVQLDHPDLQGRLLPGYDFWARDSDPSSDTRNNHGTNVAGVLGAATNNGIGIAGIAPGAQILPVRTMDNIIHQSARLAEGIVFATDRGARVASMSLAAESLSPALRRAVDYASRRGVVLVGAIGNEFHFHHNYPQTFDPVIAVGGLNPDSANTAALREELAVVGSDFTVRAAYSDYGPHLDLVAPTQVPTTEIGGGYRFTWSGTSAATPHVAGVAALVLSRAAALGLTLSAGEVRQVMIQTADDLSDTAKGFRPGWDRLTGWGRVNAARAVERVGPGRIPPDADIVAPDWYRPAATPFAVRGRTPAGWTLELGRGEEPTVWRRIAGAAASGPKVRRLARIDPRGLEAGGWTLRLRARDAQGNLGEDRAFFFALRDPRLQRGFPKDLGSSGESSPAPANLAGGRAAEIVLATSEGLVHVLDGRTGRDVRGWPRGMRGRGAASLRRRIGRVRRGFVATPAVGDIAGDRRREVVAAGLDGRVYVWTARGRRLRGFPVRIDLRGATPRLDGAIYASPALADLSGDGKLDIVVGAADQKVYAWNGRGRRLPGWPVLARDPAGGDEAKILSSPAVGDLDGDRSPDVVEGTAEAYGSTPDTTGRVHAWTAAGRPLPGWPVKPSALAADSIPLAGEGVPASPVLADVDGDGRDEVAIATFTGQPELFRGDGSRYPGAGVRGHFSVESRGASSRSNAVAQIALGSNFAFGRMSNGGPLRLFSGLVDAQLGTAQVSPASRVPFEHLLGGWDARSGEPLAGFPAPVEGWTVLAGPAVADVDGDGRAEAIYGSSGYLLHAFREDGSEPPGWPKQTGGWLLAAPAVANVDGDAHLEVVAVTREGFLFVWDTPAPGDAPREWPSFRHDTRNSGRYP